MKRSLAEPLQRRIASNVASAASLFGGNMRSRLPNRADRLILYLEWIVLGLAFVLEIRPAKFSIDALAQILVIRPPAKVFHLSFNTSHFEHY